MKSGLSFLLLAVLAYALSACGGGGSNPTQAPVTGAPSPPPPLTGTGAATLNWTPPTTRADGSPLGELAGYRVLYGMVSGHYDRVDAIDNPGISIYVIDGLSPGTWYFAIQSVTSDGLVSAPSEEVSKSI